MKLIIKNVVLPLADGALRIHLEMEGESIALFGPSGAGKTSVLDLIAGIRSAHSGYIRIDSEVLMDSHAGYFVPPAKRGFGYVPQDAALFPHLSVRANILYGSKQGTIPLRFTLKHIADILEIDHLLDSRVGTLSGGEKQRVALARALLCQPRILLLDEPLASLDEGLKRSTFALLLTIRAEFGLPMIYVSHSVAEISALCDMVVTVELGRATRVGTPAELFTLSLLEKANVEKLVRSNHVSSGETHDSRESDSPHFQRSKRLHLARVSQWPIGWWNR